MFKFWCWTFAGACLLASCGSDKADEPMAPGGSGEAGAPSPGAASGAGGSSSQGGSNSGRAGTSNQTAAGGQGEGGGEDGLGAGGSPDEAPGDGQGGETDPGNLPVSVNGCGNFADRTAEEASRQIPWSEEPAFYPMRCIEVRVGQTVRFVGDFEAHPLEPFGGDMPNPIAAVVTFVAPGTFGFVCPLHAGSMIGAIRVVP